MEKTLQFVSVTGCSEDIARKYLEACAGDIDMAIGMHLENQVVVDGASSPQDLVPAAHDNSVTKSSEEFLSPTSYEKVHGVRAPIPQTTGVLIGEEAIPRKMLRSRKLPQTVFDPFQDYSTVASRTAHSSKHGNAKDKQNLAEIFRPPHDILFTGTFHEAKLAGQQKMRWLLINLQDTREFASQVLNRDVWSNYNVRDLVKRNFVFMQIYRISDEGAQFKQMYGIDCYPSLVIIDPRTGEKMLSWGGLSADGFIHEVSEFLVNNPYEEEGPADQHHKKVIINLSEESQLEAAIKASLEESVPNNHTLTFSDDSDTDYISLSPSENSFRTGIQSIGKSSQHSEGVNNDDRTSVVMVEAAQEYNDMNNCKGRKRPSSSGDDTELLRKKMRSDLDPVCAGIDSIELTRGRDGSDSGGKQVNGKRTKGKGSKGKGKAKGSRSRGLTAGVPDESDGGNETRRTVEELLASGDVHKDQVTQILFRLPDGTRLQKSFLCTHPVEELFVFLENQGIKVTEHDIETHFPKRSLTEMNRNTSLKHNGLYPRETVFVSTV